VYNSFQSGIKYLKYFFTASNRKGHGTHSPFIFHFINKVLNDKTAYRTYDIVETIRRGLIKDQRLLNIEDLGAGSSTTRSSLRSVASIARHAAKSEKYGQLLFRMVKEYQPAIILELGTSLGITSSYFAFAKPDAKIITIEGAGEVAAVAEQNFNKLQLHNITVVKGNFDDTLSGVLKNLSSIDFAFIDGNHRKEPTERYFIEILSRIHNDTILIFDDIHWSKEMEGAWDTIKDHPSVRCTIDLFFFGILFFRNEFKEKQHFTIRY